MGEGFKIDILTPERAVVQGLGVRELLIPTFDGQINVLPKHTHILYQIIPGTLALIGCDPDNQDRNFILTSGICKVLDNHIAILSLTVEEGEQIDFERAKKAFEKSEKILNYSENLINEDLVKYRRKNERAPIAYELISKKLSIHIILCEHSKNQLSFLNKIHFSNRIDITNEKVYSLLNIILFIFLSSIWFRIKFKKETDYFCH